jgi:hypothetical protein
VPDLVFPVVGRVLGIREHGEELGRDAVRRRVVGPDTALRELFCGLEIGGAVEDLGCEAHYAAREVGEVLATRDQVRVPTVEDTDIA